MFEHGQFRSKHDNHDEDRWWDYHEYCITHSGEQITKGNSPDAYFQMNDWDQDFSWTATTGRTIYGMNSRHWNTKEDRLYQVKTVEMIPEFEYTGGCSTTAEVNNFDGDLDYTCPLVFEYIAGMSSVNSNSNEDRRWKYTCCKMAAKSCGFPASFTSGSWNCNRQTVGGVCSHSCATGTRSTSASGTVTCQSNKFWSTRNFQCNTINCGNPSNPTNGQFNCGSTTYQGTCSMSCNNGYQLSAAATITCSDYTSSFGWSSYSSSCNTITNYCPAPPTSITLGSVSCQPTTRSIGTVCTYSCDSGYVVDGTSQRVVPVTCLSSTASVGVWSRATPTCVLYAEHCPHTMAAPTNGAVNCDGYSLGGICTVSCNAGFRLRGYAPLATVDSVCKADTTWSRPETFYCDPIACPALSLGNGGLNCVGGTTAYNSQCTPYCNAGFTLEGDYTGAVRCNASQLWNATLSAHCQIVSCDPLTLENGAIDCTNGNTNYLSECTPSCNAGYTLGGANTNPVTCQASREWSATLQAECTIVSCDPLTLENGAVLCTNDNTNYGSECIPSCNPGYSLGGDYADVVECLATREWDRPMDASCTIVACDVLTLPHGTVNCTNNSTDFGSECTSSCDSGYQLVGGYTGALFCNSSRYWNVTFTARCEFIESGTATATALGAGVGAGFFVLLLLLLFLLVLARRRRSRSKKPLPEQNSQSMILVPSELRQSASAYESTVENETYSELHAICDTYDSLQRPATDTYSALNGGAGVYSQPTYLSSSVPRASMSTSGPDALNYAQIYASPSGGPATDEAEAAPPAYDNPSTGSSHYDNAVFDKATEALGLSDPVSHPSAESPPDAATYANIVNETPEPAVEPSEDNS
ncbi:hypothetical protein CAOG_008320 [Capsaspora owczarzaki ATCC 30864]|uniref:Sushi domain-containing protein n=1 Tax=Capsaspora owczarzaki (strain ATCC 30864) TaxID=595528 RepID=A0A0D2W1X2_CAPO3|nr:hypothetical protein CAOG_008320 [Capsaspora owczarzaki ATCC 30864]